MVDNLYEKDNPDDDYDYDNEEEDKDSERDPLDASSTKRKTLQIIAEHPSWNLKINSKCL